MPSARARGPRRKSAPKGSPPTALPANRRLLIGVGALLLVLAAAALLGRPALEGALTSRQALSVGGRILLPTDSGLVVMSLNDRRETLIVPAATGELVTSAAWSPDRSQVAYGFFHRRAGDPASVSEIYLAGADGSGARPLAERDRPGAVLDTPVWSTDGRDIYFSYFGQVGNRSVQRIERVNVGSGDRQTVVEDGYAPALAPDGKGLIFQRDERSGTGVWLQPLAGGQPTTVIAPGRYPSLAVPRLSPDGKQLAVAIINVNAAEAPSDGPFGWLLPPVAYAHGQPWDIWTFDLQGNNPRRLTQINADDPSPTWSPDGRYIAFWSGSGLFIVGADGSDFRKVLDKGGYGPIDWAP